MSKNMNETSSNTTSNAINNTISNTTSNTINNTTSKIRNYPKIKNALVRAVREQLEHRALWMYLLCDEARKKGLPPEEYVPEAIRRCGIYQGGELVKKGGTTSLKGLKKHLFTKPAQWIFEMDFLKSTDDELHIDFHYYPLIAAVYSGLKSPPVRRSKSTIPEK